MALRRRINKQRTWEMVGHTQPSRGGDEERKERRPAGGGKKGISGRNTTVLAQGPAGGERSQRGRSGHGKRLGSGRLTLENAGL